MSKFQNKAFFVLLSLTLSACGQDTGYGGAGSGAGSVSCSPCRIFSTTTAVAGDFGGAAAADAVCNTDASRPNSSNYKALLWTSTRSPTSDWPIKSGVAYVRADGSTAIGTGGSDGFIPPPLTNSIITASPVYHWTGIDIAGFPAMAQSSHTCTGWTDGTSGVSGATGTGSLTASSAYVGMNATGRGCNGTNRFYCVEQ